MIYYTKYVWLKCSYENMNHRTITLCFGLDQVFKCLPRNIHEFYHTLDDAGEMPGRQRILFSLVSNSVQNKHVYLAFTKKTHTIITFSLDQHRKYWFIIKTRIYRWTHRLPVCRVKLVPIKISIYRYSPKSIVVHPIDPNRSSLSNLESHH